MYIMWLMRSRQDDNKLYTKTQMLNTHDYNVVSSSFFCFSFQLKFLVLGHAR